MINSPVLATLQNSIECFDETMTLGFLFLIEENSLLVLLILFLIWFLYSWHFLYSFSFRICSTCLRSSFIYRGILRSLHENRNKDASNMWKLSWLAGYIYTCWSINSCSNKHLRKEIEYAKEFGTLKIYFSIAVLVVKSSSWIRKVIKSG